MKAFVFVNGYGLVKFKAVEKIVCTDGNALYSGVVKLKTSEGSKWMAWDYYFSENEIYESKLEALETMMKKLSYRD